MDEKLISLLEAKVEQLIEAYRKEKERATQLEEELQKLRSAGLAERLEKVIKEIDHILSVAGQ